MKKIGILFLCFIIFCSAKVYALENNSDIVENDTINTILGSTTGTDNVLEDDIDNELEEENDEEEEENNEDLIKNDNQVVNDLENEEEKEEEIVSLKKAPASDEEDETLEEEAPEQVATLEEESDDDTDEVTPDDDVHGGVVYDIQKAIVTINKYIEGTDTRLAGAKLGLLDSNGEPIATWVSEDDKGFEIQLPEGTYTVEELEAPEGYDLAPNKEFTIKIEIADVDAGSDASVTPCPHYTGTQMYYVEINSVKHEVYCINQNWDTPDENSQYNGEILNSGSIRDYTMQRTAVGIQEEDPTKAIISEDPIDVSDQSLNDDKLYNKILDIIYHRHIALSVLDDDYTIEELRFVTEVALKNYTNPGLAELQMARSTTTLLNQLEAAGVIYKTHVINGVNWVSYLKHNYRDFLYNPDAPLGTDIYVMDYGNGNSFGQMVAAHWNSFTGKPEHLHPDADPATASHNAKNNQAERDTVARYYRLFTFLISDDEEYKHPSDMNLYIYSSETIPEDPAGNNYDSRYQNLLGITGYFEEIEQQSEEVNIYNSYSTEETSVTVKKVWDDEDNKYNNRPDKITVKLSNGDTVTLNEENDWTATISNLPKYDKGTPIEYTWEEIDAPKGYVIAGNTVVGDTTTITNKTELINIRVRKEWHDGDDEKQQRPGSVVITLLADNEFCEEYEFKASENWYHEFKNLPKYKDGKEIEYTVVELEVPGEYKVAYTGSVEDILIVHNGLEYGDTEPPPPPTGDNIYSYVTSLIIGVIGIIPCAVYLKKYKH